jgi:hypothetical protein
MSDSDIRPATPEEIAERYSFGVGRSLASWDPLGV